MRWLQENIRHRAAFALKNSRYALTVMIQEVTLADERFVAQITTDLPRQIRTYLDEPINTREFANHLHSA
jgi:hypothetical protein